MDGRRVSKGPPEKKFVVNKPIDVVDGIIDTHLTTQDEDFHYFREDRTTGSVFFTFGLPFSESILINKLDDNTTEVSISPPKQTTFDGHLTIDQVIDEYRNSDSGLVPKTGEASAGMISQFERVIADQTRKRKRNQEIIQSLTLILDPLETELPEKKGVLHSPKTPENSFAGLVSRIGQDLAVNSTGITRSQEAEEILKDEGATAETVEKFVRISHGRVFPESAAGIGHNEAITGKEKKLAQEPLSQLEQAILDVIGRLVEEKRPLTNGIVAGELFEKGIYNKRSGEAYSNEYISRTKSQLRAKGYKV